MVDVGKAARRAARAARRAEAEAQPAQGDAAELLADAAGPMVGVLDAPTALSRLTAAAAVRSWLDDVEAGAVADLRAVGVPWATIGRALGVSGQAVSKRFGGRR